MAMYQSKFRQIQPFFNCCIMDCWNNQMPGLKLERNSQIIRNFIFQFLKIFKFFFKNLKKKRIYYGKTRVGPWMFWGHQILIGLVLYSTRRVNRRRAGSCVDRVEHTAPGKNQPISNDSHRHTGTAVSSGRVFLTHQIHFFKKYSSFVEFDRIGS